MVLTLKRAAYVATIVASIVAVITAPLSAQQPAPPATSSLRHGEAHPLLFGFALECAVGCAPGERGRGRSGGGSGATLYSSFPHVLAIAPGSAAEQAGIHPGDVLKSIDGLSVLTDAGATRLTNASAGETVRLEFERDAKPVVVSLVLGAIPNPQNGRGPTRIFGGYVAMRGEIRVPVNVSLEIWSDEPMFPQDSGGTTVLRIGTSTVIKLRLVPDSSGNRTGRGGAGDSVDRAPAVKPLLLR